MKPRPAVLVSFVGAFVLLGWILSLEWVLSLRPAFVTMKPLTALTFLAAGLGLSSPRLRFPCAIWVLGLAALSVLGAFGVPVNFFESTDAVRSTAPGVPSVATIACFTLTGMAMAIDSPTWRHWAQSICFSAGAVGGLGYALSDPRLYFESDWSSAMALHTAGTFLFVAFAFADDEAAPADSLKGVA